MTTFDDCIQKAENGVSDQMISFEVKSLSGGDVLSFSVDDEAIVGTLYAAYESAFEAAYDKAQSQEAAPNGDTSSSVASSPIGATTSPFVGALVQPLIGATTSPIGGALVQLLYGSSYLNPAQPHLKLCDHYGIKLPELGNKLELTLVMHAIKPGDKLRIEGLQNSPTLNGKVSQVIEWDANSRRFHVAVFNAATGELETKKVKHENLQIWKPDLEPGHPIAIQGLQNAPALNGKTGELVAFDVEKGRWQVRLDEGNEIKSVKPGNLTNPGRDPLNQAFAWIAIREFPVGHVHAAKLQTFFDRVVDAAVSSENPLVDVFRLRRLQNRVGEIVQELKRRNIRNGGVQQNPWQTEMQQHICLEKSVLIFFKQSGIEFEITTHPMMPMQIKQKDVHIFWKDPAALDFWNHLTAVRGGPDGNLATRLDGSNLLFENWSMMG